MVHYIGVLEPEYYDADVEVIPITYPFANSHIWWPIEKQDFLKLNFDFKSSKPLAVLASGDVTVNKTSGYWEVSETQSLKLLEFVGLKRFCIIRSVWSTMRSASSLFTVLTTP